MKRGTETSIGDGIQAFLREFDQENPFLKEIAGAEKKVKMLRWQSKVYDQLIGIGTLDKRYMKAICEVADFNKIGSHLGQEQAEMLEHELDNLMK